MNLAIWCWYLQFISTFCLHLSSAALTGWRYIEYRLCTLSQLRYQHSTHLCWTQNFSSFSFILYILWFNIWRSPSEKINSKIFQLIKNQKRLKFLKFLFKFSILHFWKHFWFLTKNSSKFITLGDCGCNLNWIFSINFSKGGEKLQFFRYLIKVHKWCMGRDGLNNNRKELF